MTICQQLTFCIGHMQLASCRGFAPSCCSVLLEGSSTVPMYSATTVHRAGTIDVGGRYPCCLRFQVKGVKSTLSKKFWSGAEHLLYRGVDVSCWWRQCLCVHCSQLRLTAASD